MLLKLLKAHMAGHFHISVPYLSLGSPHPEPTTPAPVRANRCFVGALDPMKEQRLRCSLLTSFSSLTPWFGGNSCTEKGAREQPPSKRLMMKVVVAESLNPVRLLRLYGLSSVHRILQARMLEWVGISSSRCSSQPGNRTQVSCLAGRFFTDWASKGSPLLMMMDAWIFASQSPLCGASLPIRPTFLLTSQGPSSQRTRCFSCKNLAPCAEVLGQPESPSLTTANPNPGTWAWRASISITLRNWNTGKCPFFFLCRNILPGSPSAKLCGLLQEDQPSQQAQWIKETQLGNDLVSSWTSKFIFSFMSGSLGTLSFK